MWKNSEKRFNVLWRRWLRESGGGAKILLFWASHNCQMPCAKIKSHGIEEGLESWCLVRLTPSHAWRSKEKNSRDLVLGRDNQNSLARGQWQWYVKLFQERDNVGKSSESPEWCQIKMILWGTVEKALQYENSYLWGTCSFSNPIPVSCIWFQSLADKQKFCSLLDCAMSCGAGP